MAWTIKGSTSSSKSSGTSSKSSGSSSKGSSTSSSSTSSKSSSSSSGSSKSSGTASKVAGLGAMIAGAAASAVSKTISSSKKSSSSSSSKSSGSSSSTYSGPEGYGNGPGKFEGSAEEWDRLDTAAKLYAEQWHQATTKEEKDRLHQLAYVANKQLGRTYDGTTGKWYNGYARPTEPKNRFSSLQQIQETDDQTAAAQNGQNDQLAQYGAMLQSMFNKYYGDEASRRRQEQIEAENRARVEQNVNQLSAQKDKINQAGAEGNAAAQQAYMKTINPNGSLAESLAARGLLSSGLTESSQIAAGNAYQNALNSNKTTVMEQLGEIERAISNARLSGDLATAEQLQAWYNNVASAAMQNAQNIVSAGQWQQQFDQSASQWQQQFNLNKNLQEAELMGYYNGIKTLQGQSAQDQHTSVMTQEKINQLTLQIMQATGLSQAEAELEALRIANQGQTLQNQGQTLQNQGQQLANQKTQQEIDYNAWQLAQNGIR